MIFEIQNVCIKRSYNNMRKKKTKRWRREGNSLQEYVLRKKRCEKKTLSQITITITCLLFDFSVRNFDFISFWTYKTFFIITSFYSLSPSLFVEQLENFSNAMKTFNRQMLEHTMFVNILIVIGLNGWLLCSSRYML